MTIMRSDVEELLTVPGLPCVSLFLTVEGTPPGSPADRLRLKQLLRDAGGALEAWGLRPGDAADVLAPARGLLDAEPWRNTGRALALYAARDGFTRRFGLDAPVADRVVVDDRFQLGPVIRDAVRGNRFWLLAISRNQVRLFRGGADRLRSHAADLPTFEDVVGVDDPEESLQYHRGTGGPAAATVAYHGHGGAKDADQDRVRRWLQGLAGAVDEALRTSVAPLVLAGVADQLVGFRQAVRYEPLVAAEIHGSPNRSAEAQLHARAWPLVRAWFDQARERDLIRYREHDGTPWTSCGLEDVATAAEGGRIDVLFAPIDPSVDEETQVDDAVVAVWTTGGTVHLMDSPIPGGRTLAAILRYPTASPAGSRQG